MLAVYIRINKKKLIMEVVSCNYGIRLKIFLLQYSYYKFWFLFLCSNIILQKTILLRLLTKLKIDREI